MPNPTVTVSVYRSVRGHSVYVASGYRRACHLGDVPTGQGVTPGVMTLLAGLTEVYPRLNPHPLPDPAAFRAGLVFSLGPHLTGKGHAVLAHQVSEPPNVQGRHTPPRGTRTGHVIGHIASFQDRYVSTAPGARPERADTVTAAMHRVIALMARTRRPPAPHRLPAHPAVAFHVAADPDRGPVRVHHGRITTPGPCRLQVQAVFPGGTAPLPIAEITGGPHPVTARALGPEGPPSLNGTFGDPMTALWQVIAAYAEHRIGQPAAVPSPHVPRRLPPAGWRPVMRLGAGLDDPQDGEYPVVLWSSHHTRLQLLGRVSGTRRGWRVSRRWSFTNTVYADRTAGVLDCLLQYARAVPSEHPHARPA